MSPNAPSMELWRVARVVGGGRQRNGRSRLWVRPSHCRRPTESSPRVLTGQFCRAANARPSRLHTVRTRPVTLARSRPLTLRLT